MADKLDSKLTDELGGDPQHDNDDKEENLEKRQSKLTEKGIEYALNVKHGIFRKCVSTWRRAATDLGKAICQVSNLTVLQTGIDTLEEEFDSITSAYRELEAIASQAGKENKFREYYDHIEIDQYDVTQRALMRVDELRRNAEERESRASRSICGSKARSHHSNASTRSDVAVEAATLKAKLKFIDIESAKRAELERIETMKRLHIAEAKLGDMVDQDSVDDNLMNLDEPMDKGQYVNNYVQSQMEMNKPIIKQEFGGNTPTLGSIIPASVQDNTEPQIGMMTVPINYNMEPPVWNRLPSPEPEIFNGDPLKYPGWKTAFTALIEQRGVPFTERIYYLKRYLGGSAKETVEGYFLMSTPEAFDEAKCLLERRYGNPFVIADAFREKLESWPKLQSRDSTGLRKFADYLRQCESAMQSMGTLTILDDMRENRKLLYKLPEWLVTRWARIVSDWKQSKGLFPPFKEFVRFMVKEADIACDPVTSLQQLKPSSQSTTREPKKAWGANTHSSGANESPHLKSQRNENTRCLSCMNTHDLDDCESFLSKPIRERKQFAWDKKLCFSCMSKGHTTRDCKNKRTCRICTKRHPTSLHGDYRPKYGTPHSDKKEGTHSSVSCLSRVSGGCKSSLILPVWIYHKDKPSEEKLVDALLDTQSDTTFLLEKTCDDLGLRGVEVKLSLSTMSAENQIVNSRKVNGLVVRGYDSALQISLPGAYTREIMPVNKDHIPVPDTARNWSHLKPIADKLMPAREIDVGLLIGYDCAQALAPREVSIAEDKDPHSPYGQRTDLGWGIVGIVSQDGYTGHEVDPIGFSHKVVACVVSAGQKKDLYAPNHVSVCYRTCIKEVINPVDINRMMELDFNEKYGDTSFSQDDVTFLSKMNEGIHKRQDNHYEMPLNHLRNWMVTYHYQTTDPWLSAGYNI